jgi:hypothetical protein
MRRLRPLSDHPPAALHGLQGAIATLLRYQDMLPSDLHVKLDLLHDDITAAIAPSPRRTAVFTPHPATPAITHPERHPR